MREQAAGLGAAHPGPLCTLIPDRVPGSSAAQSPDGTRGRPAPQIDWIDAQQLEPEAKEADPKAHEEAWAMLKGADGVLVPGAFPQSRC